MPDQSKIYKRRWWTLTVLSLSVIIVVIDSTILNVALPTLQRELDASGSELQWMVDAYVLALAGLLLTMGALGDRLGRARILRAGIAIFAGASLGAMFADSAEHVIAARIFMGVGAAMIMPSVLATITSIFPRKERGKAIGIWSALNSIGFAVGPAVGGLLLEHFSWGAIFFLNIPVAAVAMIVGWFLVPNTRDPHPQRLDVPGTLLSASALSILVFGLVKGGDWGWSDPLVIGTMAIAVGLGIVFVLWEKHTTTPMLDMQLFQNARFSAGAGGIAVMLLGQFGIIFGLTLYMQFVLGYSALETGIRFLPLAAGAALGAGTSHRRVDRFGTTYVVAGGFLGMGALAMGASFWEIDTAFWQLGTMLFLWGFAMGNILAPSVDSVLGAVPETRSGVGSAMNSVSVHVGSAIGVASLGSVMSSVYTSELEPKLAMITGLPAEFADAARDSVGTATIIADQLPENLGNALALAAHQSFIDGWQMMAFVVCAIALTGMSLTLKFLPARHLQPEGVDQLSYDAPAPSHETIQ